MLGVFISFFAWSQDTTSLAKSGRRPRFILRPFVGLNKPVFSKSPFSFYTLPGEKLQISVQDNQLISSQQLGNLSVSPVQAFSFQEYGSQQDKTVNQNYWRAYSKSLDGVNSIQSRGLFPKIELPPAIDRIFGGSEISFKPNGSLLLDIGYMGQFVDNPAIPVQLRYIGNLFFNEQAQLNFQGKIGDKLNLNANLTPKPALIFKIN